MSYRSAPPNLRPLFRRPVPNDPLRPGVVVPPPPPLYRVSKRRTDRNQVFGWASVVAKNGNQLVDHQQHMIDTDELEEAAYRFVKNRYPSGELHLPGGLTGELIESMVFTPEKVAKLGLPSSVPTGWWVGFQYPPQVFAKVKTGKYRMFSIQGGAVLEPVPD